MLVDSIDNLVMASVWGTLAQPELSDENLIWAQSTLLETLGSSEKADRRFFPRLIEVMSAGRLLNPNREPAAFDFSADDPLMPEYRQA